MAYLERFYESIGVAEGEESEVDQERKREGFARDLRADYDLGEFRVSGSLTCGMVPRPAG